MVKYILKRIGFSIITLFIAASILFLLLQAMPGKPYNIQKVDPEQRKLLDDKYDLDEPLFLRYVKYIGGIAGFDIEIDDGKIQEVDYKVTPVFGRQWKENKQEVYMKIGKQLPVSVSVGFKGLIFGTVVGLILGTISALKRNTVWDHTLTTIAVIGVSVPSFVFASLLQYFIGGKLGLLPITYEISNTFVSSLLPSFALSLFIISSLTRYMRTELVDVLSSDYILLARAKGLSKTKVIVKHAIRNSLIPVVTVIGPLAVFLLTGSLIVEQIFTIPGLGRTLVTAIRNVDNPLILGVSFFYSVLYIVVILLVDISYGLIDPRVRVQGGAE